MCVKQQKSIPPPARGRPMTPLSIGAIYRIRSLSDCACGLAVDIGRDDGPWGVTVCDCGKRFPPGIEWYDEDCFRPLDPLEEQLLAIEENHVVEPAPQHAL